METKTVKPVKKATKKVAVKKASIKKTAKKVVVVIDTRPTDDPRGRKPDAKSARQARLRHYEEMKKKGIPVRRGRYKMEIMEKLLK